MPLILTENVRTVGGRYDHWEDATGVWYHFPNGYLNRIEAHEKFIYYRGKRREEGQGTPEYFGYGQLGETWRDAKVEETEPKGRWRWYVELDDYVAFTEPVSFKEADQYIEDVRHTNHFGTAVRVISDGVYERILNLAGSGQARRDQITVRALPPLESLALESKDVEDVFQTTKVRGTTTDKTRSTPRRRAKDSKIVGDRAEAIVYNALCKSYTEVRWLARDNVTPGWDIEYEDGRRLVRVEVKGSKGSTIQSIDITANECRGPRPFPSQGHEYSPPQGHEYSPPQGHEYSPVGPRVFPTSFPE